MNCLAVWEANGIGLLQKNKKPYETEDFKTFVRNLEDFNGRETSKMFTKANNNNNKMAKDELIILNR